MMFALYVLCFVIGAVSLGAAGAAYIERTSMPERLRLRILHALWALSSVWSLAVGTAGIFKELR